MTPGWERDVADISEAIWSTEIAWGSFGHYLSSHDQVKIARSLASRHSVARMKPQDVQAAFTDQSLRPPTLVYCRAVVKEARALAASRAMAQEGLD